jgi:hypothetical protein
MKIRIAFKSPDSVCDAVDGVAEKLIMSDDEENFIEDTKDKIYEALKTWIKYREMIVVEFDLDNGTARVVPAK